MKMLTDNRLRNRKPLWLRWPFLFVAVPLVLAVTAIAAIGYQELRVSRDVEAEINRLKAAGEPVDNESMAAWFRHNTSSEGTAAWREVLALTSGILRNDNIVGLPYLGRSGKIPQEIIPDSDWPEEPQVAEFLNEAKPILDRIHTAIKYPTPVWQPIQFNGINTLLGAVQESRSVCRLLNLEVEHALYRRDTDRALFALQSMKGVSEAFNWDFCIMANFVNIAIREHHWSVIRRSLGTGLWNDMQVAELMTQVGQAREINLQWFNVVAGERALILASLNPGLTTEDVQQFSGGQPMWLGWQLTMPSVKRTFLQDLQDWQHAAGTSVVGLGERTRRLTSKISDNASQLFDLGNFVSEMLGFSFGGHYARSFELEELNRRFTIAALGIKRFHQEKGHWPKSLNELSQIGMNSSDWSTLYVGPFGYRVDDDVAIVWGYDPNKMGLVPDEPPYNFNGDSEDKDITFDEMPWYVTKIR